MLDLIARQRGIRTFLPKRSNNGSCFMPPKAKAALFDMQHAAPGIGLFVADKTFDDYNSDLMLRSAVERQFEIIGEAMTRLPTVARNSGSHLGKDRRFPSAHKSSSTQSSHFGLIARQIFRPCSINRMCME